MLFSRVILGVFLTGAFAACSTQEPNAASDDSPQGGGKADWFGDDQPFADMSRTSATVELLPVRGRLVEDEPEDIGSLDVTPLSQVSQDELEEEPVSLWLRSAAGERHALGEFTTDDEGYLDLRLDIGQLDLAPGEHTLEIWFEEEAVGETQVTLMALDRTEPVVRSDVDWTYLRTDFHGISALTRLLREDAYDKEALPAMDLVYQGVRADGTRPLTFLSGSPRFFKRTLEAKALLDGVTQDGLILKPFKDIVATDLLSNLGGIVPDLNEQIGYKLYWLLRLREELPAGTPEVLMGDDSEADFVVYNIYTRLLRGEFEGDRLLELLESVHVSGYWLPQILELADQLGDAPPPIAIYINETEVPGDSFDIESWKLDGLTRVHGGSWPLALDLYEEGLLEADDVRGVKTRLLELGDDEQSLRARAVRADFISPETLDLF